MRAIIFGVCGQDGALLARSLAAIGIDVIGVGRAQSGPINITSFLSRYECCDASNPAEVGRVITKHQGVTLVIYCAAVHGPSGFEYERVWLDTTQVNAVAVQAILEKIKRLPDCQFVYFSSGQVFDVGQHAVIDETTPRVSRCLYTSSKNYASDIISYYREKYDVAASVLWLFNHESVRRGPQYFTSKILRALRNAEEGRDDKVDVQSLDFWCDWGWAPQWMDAIASYFGRIKCSEDFVVATGKTVWARSVVEDFYGRRGFEVSQLLNVRSTDPECYNARWSADNRKFENTFDCTLDVSGVDVFERLMRAASDG